ncbi:MAG: carbohydrate binding domain-containing protein [Pirellulales bacterium]
MKSLVALLLLSLVSLPALAAEEAPAKDAKPAAKNLLKPTNDVESWVFEVNEGGEGSMKADDEAIVFTTTKTDGTDWHVQTYQPGIDLENGRKYVIKFSMKSPQEVAVNLVGQIHQVDWHEIGLREQLNPGKDYEDFKFEFTAHDVVDGNNRVGFVLGFAEGDVFVKDISLTEATAEK